MKRNLFRPLVVGLCLIVLGATTGYTQEQTRVTKSGVPIGTITMFAGAIDTQWLEAQGWMVCDGRALDKSKYKTLHVVIGDAYGHEDNKFYIPDCRGLFVRGVSDKSKKDPDAAKRTAQKPGGNTGDMVGTHQEDALKRHKHIIRLSEKTGDYATVRAGKVSYSEATTGNSGEEETRPKNIGFYFIIKYKIFK
ncbi:MAG: tail fiber protein [bacterium]|nr:tail fiber protein [bacterium]